MPWAVVSSIDIDGEDLSAAQEITDRGEEQGASPLIRPCLDDQLWLQLMQDLLVTPEVERTLEHPVTQPEGIPPCLLVAVVVERVELINQ